MDASAAAESCPEPPQGPCPSPASDSHDETASESSSLSNSCPDTENESTPTEPECEPVGREPARGDGHGTDHVGKSHDILNKCIEQGRILQGGELQLPSALSRKQLILIGRSAKKAIESYQAGITSTNTTGEAATAEPTCQTGLGLEKAATPAKLQDDQHRLLEGIKEVFAIHEDLCSRWTCESVDDEPDYDGRRPELEQEQNMVVDHMVADLLTRNSTLQRQVLQLQKLERLKMESKKDVLGRQHEATPTDEGEVNESHRWKETIYGSIRNTERPDETPDTGGATPLEEEEEEEEEEPITQRLEKDIPEAVDGRQSPDGSIGSNLCSNPSEDASSESLATQLEPFAAELASNADSSDETTDWKQEAELQCQRARSLERLVEELRRDQGDIRSQGERHHRAQPQRDSVLPLCEPRNLSQELGYTVGSPAYMPGSPVSGFSGFDRRRSGFSGFDRRRSEFRGFDRRRPEFRGFDRRRPEFDGFDRRRPEFDGFDRRRPEFDRFDRRRPEPGFAEAHSLLKEQCLAWKDVAFFLAYILLQTWQAPGRIMYSNRHSIQKLPLLESIDWDRWEPAAQRGLPFSTKGLLRALRHVVILLSVHAYLSCRWERDIWLSGNGLTRRYLTRQLHHRDKQWWPVPGVDPEVVWEKAGQAGVLVAVQLMDVWAEWFLKPAGDLQAHWRAG